MLETGRTNIAVMGAGAVGCYYGGMLARAGHEVVLIGRPAHVQAIHAAGLLLQTQAFTERVALAASTEARAVQGAQWVLFCVKSTDTESAARAMAPHLRPGAIVLSLQNGVDNAERLQALLPQHLVLPAVTLAAGIGALMARMTRSTMLEVLDQDYVRTARAKGLKRGAVVAKHAFRNALIPILTIVGLQAGYVLGGAVLVEQVFAWPGIGTLAVNAILARDFPLVQGVTLLAASAYVLTNLLTDVAYTLVDPRISYQ